MIVGIEVGGTFTDLVLSHPERGIIVHKTPSTPSDPSEAAIRGLTELLIQNAISAGDVDELLHGSTIAANSLIQRKGAKTALIMTKGFADVIFNGRANKEAIYDLFYRKPEPLLTRSDVYEVSERTSASGAIVAELDCDNVLRVADAIVRAGAESIAVCLLHSYANPAHERRIAALVSSRFPQMPVSLSCDIAPEHREYERASTTVISAYLRPAIDRYLQKFASKVDELGIPSSPLIMQSNGGVVPVSTACRLAANMFLSGPAAAATGAAFIAKASGQTDLITIDVGGTSSDVCLINDGQPQTTVKGTAEFSVDGLPLNVLMTDIVSIGAGGGSIANIDTGGMLRVGPQSAGAAPGPACYGHGGTAFTLSDAMLLLGMLDRGAELPGGITLSSDLAVKAAAPLAAKFDLTVVELADRVYRIAVANMAQALRQVSVRRGYDPRSYSLFACGGAGPLIATALADEVGMNQILVPPNPGVFSAFGLAVAEVRIDYVRADGSLDLSKLSAADVAARLAELKGRALKEFVELGYDASSLNFVYSVDARYYGQGYELRVPLNEEVVLEAGPKSIAEAFHQLHERQYGHRRIGKRVDVVSFRLNATIPRSTPVPKVSRQASPRSLPARMVTYLGQAQQYGSIERASLDVGRDVPGPLLLVEGTSSTVIPPNWSASVDESGNLRIRRIQQPAR